MRTRGDPTDVDAPRRARGMADSTDAEPAPHPATFTAATRPERPRRSWSVRAMTVVTSLLLALGCSDRELILDTRDGMPATGEILSVAANGEAVLFWSDAENLRHPCPGCNLFLLRRPGRVPVPPCLASRSSGFQRGPVCVVP